MTTDLAIAHAGLRDRLLDAGWLIPSGVDGLYGRDVRFEGVLAAVDRLARALGDAEDPVELAFGPFIPREVFDQIKYLRNFPQLCGVVASFDGDDRAHRDLVGRVDAGEPYDDALGLSELALTPACCYPVYPTLSGELAGNGVTVTCQGYCFRHEPSIDPMRLQSFRMREHIRVGRAGDVEAWRTTWVDRAGELFDAVDLPMRTDVANDAFFGRAGRLLATSQRELELKLEFVVPVYGDECEPTACASVNLHRAHFGETFHITIDGEAAHSSCIGFGLERIVVALVARHGVDRDRWPAAVRARLDV